MNSMEGPSTAFGERSGKHGGDRRACLEERCKRLKTQTRQRSSIERAVLIWSLKFADAMNPGFDLDSEQANECLVRSAFATPILRDGLSKSFAIPQPWPGANEEVQQQQQKQKDATAAVIAEAVSLLPQKDTAKLCRCILQTRADALQAHSELKRILEEKQGLEAAFATERGTLEQGFAMERVHFEQRLAVELEKCATQRAGLEESLSQKSNLVHALQTNAQDSARTIEDLRQSALRDASEIKRLREELERRTSALQASEMLVKVAEEALQLERNTRRYALVLFLLGGLCAFMYLMGTCAGSRRNRIATRALCW